MRAEQGLARGLGQGQGRSDEPWGPWITLCLGGAIVVFYVMAQGLALLPLVGLYVATGTPPDHLPRLLMSGFNLAIALCVSCPFLVIACGLAAWARQGPSLTEYLAIRPRPVFLWTVLMVMIALGLSALNDALGRPAPEFIVHAYSTLGNFAVFWVAIALCAPLGEEVLFRGFLFAGLVRSRLGPWGAIVVTGILFTSLHLGQYGWVDLAQVLLVGLVLGWARWASGSLLPPLAMHIALNMTSLILFEISDGARSS